jgi:AbrB family looped-hinge helix DNA binding protein
MEMVKDFQRPVTYKGTVTIPVEVRRLLGVRPNGKVTFRVIAGKRVELLPTLTLAATFASVRPKRRPLDFKRMRAEAIEQHAHKAVRRLKE